MFYAFAAAFIPQTRGLHAVTTMFACLNNGASRPLPPGSSMLKLLLLARQHEYFAPLPRVSYLNNRLLMPSLRRFFALPAMLYVFATGFCCVNGKNLRRNNGVLS